MYCPCLVVDLETDSELPLALNTQVWGAEGRAQRWSIAGICEALGPIPRPQDEARVSRLEYVQEHIRELMCRKYGFANHVEMDR